MTLRTLVSNRVATFAARFRRRGSDAQLPCAAAPCGHAPDGCAHPLAGGCSPYVIPETLIGCREDRPPLHEQLESTVEALRALMERIIAGETGVRLPSSPLLACWEVKNCHQETCPSYKSAETLRCWEVAGTFCRGQIQGGFAQKLGDCRRCGVYQTPRQDVIGSIGETFNDMVAILEERQRELKDALRVASIATAAKNEFLTNMSHELRTPLNGIIGLTTLALDGDIRLEQRNNLELVLECANAQLRLINSILDLSKIEAHRLETEAAEFDLEVLIKGIVALQARRATEKGIKASWRVSPEVPRILKGDIPRLKQAIGNLLDNAVKFTRVGEVNVSVELTNQNERQAILLISVTDTGIGIPANRLAAIFDAFTQGDGSTTRQYGGAGLGLCISKQLVELLGGRLWVHSQEGVGSTFFLQLALDLVLDGRPVS